MWRIEVSATCIGSGVCAGTAPRHFAITRDNRAQPLSSPVAADETVLDAAAACPMEAITVTDLETGTVVEP